MELSIYHEEAISRRIRELLHIYELGYTTVYIKYTVSTVDSLLQSTRAVVQCHCPLNDRTQAQKFENNEIRNKKDEPDYN